MKTRFKSSIIFSILFLLGILIAIFYSLSTSPMTEKDCLSEPNFTKVMTYLENKTPLAIDDFSLRIFEGSIVFDGKKGELLGSISKEKGVIPVVVSGYEDMRNRMNATFCSLLEGSNL